jgi:glycosyltransferase involved in cell wall biosynthesis
MSSKLLIGFDASRAARAHRTGTETYALELLKGLISLAKPQHCLRLYTPHPPQPGTWPETPQVETRVIPWPRLWTHLRLSAELWQRPPDLLFVPAHVLPFYCPVPGVVTIHDLGYLHYPQAHRPFDRWYLDWTTRRHTRIARRMIADSLATKQDLVQFYGADPDRIQVIYLGRDETLKPVIDPGLIAQAKTAYNIEGDYLLYLGTLHPRKNLVRLIEAFALALSAGDFPPLKLVIAGGKGWLYQEIFARVEALGLAGQVIFPGYISESLKPALLSGAMAYLFPSLYEGFGLPVLEAMACGTPVLTSNVSSLPEVAGKAALLVNPHEPAEIAQGIIQLVANPQLRQSLIEQGFHQLRKFSWTEAAAQLLETLEQVAQTEKGSTI